MAQQLGPLLADGGLVRAHPVQGFKSRVLEVRPRTGPLLIAKLRTDDGQRFATEQAVLGWLAARAIACPRAVQVTPLQLEEEHYWLLLLEYVVGDHLADRLDRPCLAEYRHLGRYLQSVNAASGPFPDLLRMEAEPFRTWVDNSLDTLLHLDFFSRAEEASLKALLEPVRDDRLEKALALPCLVHNDPQGRNIILNESGQIAAMLDWEASLLAPAAYQVATTLVYIAHPGSPVTAETVAQRQQAFREGYGATPDPLLLAFQLQRMLGALSGVYSRQPYEAGAYLRAQEAAVDLKGYERLIRWQCEAELRRLLH